MENNFELPLRLRAMRDSVAARMATGRISLVILGLVALGTLAALDSRRAARRTELEEFVLEPIGPAPGNRQMALVQAYRNSMLWYSSSASRVAASIPNFWSGFWTGLPLAAANLTTVFRAGGAVAR